MGSENPSSADNQQETADPCIVLEPLWVVGFVDGEGSFSVSVHRSRMMHRHGGWQLRPVFQVYQHVNHRVVLDSLVTFFGCGVVRSKGPRSSTMTFAVESLRNLDRSVIPFFETHCLVVKQADFLIFSEIVRGMMRKEHLTGWGFERLVRLAYGMNANGKQRARSMDEVLAGSSETARGARSLTQRLAVEASESEREDTVRPPWRHGELGRNDPAASLATSGYLPGQRVE